MTTDSQNNDWRQVSRDQIMNHNDDTSLADASKNQLPPVASPSLVKKQVIDLDHDRTDRSLSNHRQDDASMDSDELIMCLYACVQCPLDCFFYGLAALLSE